MACKLPYDYEFLITNLGKPWHENIYKPSRKNVLLDRERAKLPLAVRYIEHQRIIDDTQKQLDDEAVEFNRLTAEYNFIKNEYRDRQYRHWTLRRDLKRTINSHKNDMERDVRTFGQVTATARPSRRNCM